MATVYRMTGSGTEVMDNVSAPSSLASTFEGRGVLEFNHADACTRILMTPAELLKTIRTCASLLESLQR